MQLFKPVFLILLEVLSLPLRFKQQLPLTPGIGILVPDNLLHANPSLLELLKVLSPLCQCRL